MTNDVSVNTDSTKPAACSAGQDISISYMFKRLVPVLCAICSLFMIYSCASTPDAEDVNKAEAHNKLGFSYLEDGQLNEANLEFQKALALNPKNKETLNYLGYIRKWILRR